MKSLFNLLTGILAISVMLLSCGDAPSKKESSASITSPKKENFSNNHGQAGVKDDVSKQNILQVAIGSKDHTTLVAAVQAAELENVLVNAGPLTVFAPTNAAFDLLPDGTVESLLKPENKGALANIIKYHATPGNYKKDFLKRFKKLGQANNQYTSVEVKNGDVYVGGAKIIASVPCGNGIVHVVDKVILPPAKE